MVLIKNKLQKIKLNTKKLQKHAEKILKALKYDDFDIGILITTNKTIQKFNQKFRSKNKPTDILSFPYHTKLKPGKKITPNKEDDRNLGDIIISPEFILKENQKQSLEKKLNILLAHGIAHLLGYNHKTQKSYVEMQKFEKKLLKIIDKN
jgi:rRNA maturation RNase YbeY